MAKQNLVDSVWSSEGSSYHRSSGTQETEEEKIKSWIMKFTTDDELCIILSTLPIRRRTGMRDPDADTRTLLRCAIDEDERDFGHMYFDGRHRNRIS